MLGYSDSNKDGGLSISVDPQGSTTIDSIGDEFGVKVTFFHGRGGITVGGGINLWSLPLNHPSIRIVSAWRIEVIGNKYGNKDAAIITPEMLVSAAINRMITQKRAIQYLKSLWSHYGSSSGS